MTIASAPSISFSTVELVGALCLGTGLLPGGMATSWLQAQGICGKGQTPGKSSPCRQSSLTV